LATTLLPNTLSTIGSWARFIAQGLDACGVDSRQLFLDAGIDLAESENPNVRFPVHKMSRVWQLAVERTGDPCFALTLASHANPSMYNALGMSMVSSRTLGEALHRGCRFSQIASEGATVVLRERGDGNVALALQMSAAQVELVALEAMEAFMATTTHILRNISRNGLKPLAVHFRHNRGPHRKAYEDFFQAPLVFDAQEYKIVIPRAALAYKCDQANPELAENLDLWMSEYLASFEASSLSIKVRRLLAEKLPDGEYKQDEVANALAMSTRSLQRSLQKEGVSFKQLLEITRRDLAMNYIEEKQLSIIEICCLLGFSDQSNFTKAFKRWTGQTPFSYRQALAARA
jgi:AraC-like DNA-binding protein